MSLYKFETNPNHRIRAGHEIVTDKNLSEYLKGSIGVTIKHSHDVEYAKSNRGDGGYIYFIEDVTFFCATDKMVRLLEKGN